MQVQQNLAFMAAQNGLVKSIQTISITITAGNTSGTGTLPNAVGYSAGTNGSASEHLSGYTVAANAQNSATDKVGIALTSATQVTATINTANASDITVQATVIDWNPSKITSIQRGTLTMTAANSNTAALTFTLANSVVQYNGNTCTYTGTNPNHYLGGCFLTSGTLNVARGGTTNNMTVYYCLIEFAAGVLNSNTQQLVASGTGASYTTAVSAVTLAQTMLVYGGQTYTGGSSTADTAQGWYNLNSTTQMTVTRTGTSVGTGTAYAGVLEFKSTDIKSVNRGSIAITSGNLTGLSTSFTAVDQTKTIANLIGISTDGPSTNIPARKYCKLTFNSSTQMLGTRQDSTSLNPTLGVEAIEFA